MEHQLQTSEQKGITVTTAERISAMKQNMEVIQQVMRDVMKENEHYGTIPGTKKPSLYKAGAEKLSFVFRLAPDYTITEKDFGNGHREFSVLCKVNSIESGKFLGSGVGSCSTMESKYRYRDIPEYEVTEEPIPADAKDNKKFYREKGFGMQKVNSVWVWVKYKDSQKIENPDIADTYNTVLKMAKKRALIDATLTVTAASDIFTQDVEDLVPEKNQDVEDHKQPEKKSEPVHSKEEHSEPEKPKGDVKKISPGEHLKGGHPYWKLSKEEKIIACPPNHRAAKKSDGQWYMLPNDYTEAA